MIAVSSPDTWLAQLAATAQQRVEHAYAVLDAVLGALDRAAEATDWRSPAARRFHDDIRALRAAAVQERADAAQLASRIGALRAGLASAGCRP